VLLHIGDGQWILVDSLVDADGIPSPLRYLRDIGVDPKSALRLILATHWHDDHIQGLSELYRLAQNAVMSMPQAMISQEVDAFIERVQLGGTERVSSGVRELATIANIQGNEGRSAIRLAKINTVLFRTPAALSHGGTVTVEAISPNDFDIAAFIASLATVHNVPGRRVMPFDRNDISVALWISIGSSNHLLLGADLENSDNTQRGWHAVLNSPAPISGRASFIKIPHHGSENGHHEPVWDDLLTNEPHAALTTWNRGKKLPRVSDAKRILALTPNAFVSSTFERGSRRRRLAAVDRTLREAGIDIRAMQPRAGQIRFRQDAMDPAANWTVDLYNGASELSDIMELL
jgi:hypothetical protein